MEKVIVEKRIPGILEVGDILVSNGFGEDFVLKASSKTKNTASERYVNLDYYSVVENIPEYFMFVVEEFYGEDEAEFTFEVRRSNEDIYKRYLYFVDQINESAPGSESDVVHHNLAWFIEWLVGNKPLIK